MLGHFGKFGQFSNYFFSDLNLRQLLFLPVNFNLSVFKNITKILENGNNTEKSGNFVSQTMWVPWSVFSNNNFQCNVLFMRTFY